MRLGNSEVDNPHAVPLKRITNSGCRTAAHLPQITDAERGTIRHIAVPCHHGSLIILWRQNNAVVRLIQDLSVNIPVFFCPAVCLGSAGNGEGQLYVRENIPQSYHLECCYGVKANSTPAEKTPVSFRISLIEASEQVITDYGEFVPVQYPMPCKKGRSSDLFRPEII